MTLSALYRSAGGLVRWLGAWGANEQLRRTVTHGVGRHLQIWHNAAGDMYVHSALCLIEPLRWSNRANHRMRHCLPYSVLCHIVPTADSTSAHSALLNQTARCSCRRARQSRSPLYCHALRGSSSASGRSFRATFRCHRSVTQCLKCFAVSAVIAWCSVCICFRVGTLCCEVLTCR